MEQKKKKGFLLLHVNNVLTGMSGAIPSPGSVILTFVNYFFTSLHPIKINKIYWGMNCYWEGGKLWAQHKAYQFPMTLNRLKPRNYYAKPFFLILLLSTFRQTDREVVILNEAQWFEFLHGGTWLVHLLNPYFWIPAVLLNNSKNLSILHHLCLSLWNDIFIYYKCDKVGLANL